MSGVSPKAIFARLSHWLLAAGALFILASGTLQPVTGIAQPVDGTRRPQNAWIKLCFDAPYAQSNAGSGSPKLRVASETVNACFSYVEQRGQPTGLLVGIIGVLHATALDRTVLVALLPLGSALPPEAFADQPVQASAQDETQRRVIELLVRKYQDFIQ